MKVPGRVSVFAYLVHQSYCTVEHELGEMVQDTSQPVTEITTRWG